ncbi:hypothetical protein [Tetragenococcus koreensis]|uniref:Uncharacterized protein n=1 Tax=Tetragenococcus koreensis TaxID=290335 RepID=A0AAN4UBU4_9ENTE|nr:hypothetical protein [Tetragenococcus koreensis]GEQ49556.1 hypothetical protein TK11N_14080 [Tetragenococcus koreensis]GEQ52002.1 hypothetical protein TK12N_13460 [Tetragenococcus koreensis]GEQ54537.1 hypothetical protein TK2N_13810 [Tetragenococcus koreensis]GEQ57004.1 hypothetical protein TK4N_13470 [Tetragenococcus koreensis]GEQ59569.1 hypothetical protein TK6N_14080 [Tetragenococcus koreensis]
MEKPFLKKANVLIAAIFSLSICVVGYYVSNQSQYKQRVAYASSAQAKEEAELNDLEKQINEFYTNDNKELLKEDSTLSEAAKLKSKVDNIKVSATDFQIKEESVPEEMKNIAKEKKVLANDLVNISDKLHIQDQVEQLFTKKLPNWQKFEDTVVIKDELKNEEINDINENLGFFSEDQWLELVKSYLTSASEQVQEINDIQQKLTKYQNEELSYEQYLTLAEQIEQVRNPKQQDEFKKAADELGERFGVSTDDIVAENAEGSTTADETTSSDEQGLPIEQEETAAY